MKVISKILAGIMMSLVSIGPLYGQEISANKALQIGDTMAPITVGNIINRSAKKVELAQLAQKGLLIIDFWATWCIPCLAEMKLLDSLKAAHPDRFNVLMVTTQDSLTVKKFFEENKDLRADHLYLSTNNEELKQWFPHRYLPHNVWLDKSLKLRAITSSEEMTAKNILGFSLASSRQLDRKEDNMKFNYFEEFHLADSSYTYRSQISPYIKGVSGLSRGNHPLSKVSNQHLYVNGSIPQLLWSAYMGGAIRYQLIEVHTKDSLRFFAPTGEKRKWLGKSKYETQQQWYQENMFCYALTLPKMVSVVQKRDYIFNDFERQFNIKISVEPRKTMVVQVSGGQKLAAANYRSKRVGNPMVKWLPNHQLQIKGATLEEVCNWFFHSSQARAVPYPFVVKTKAHQYLEMTIDFKPYLNTALQGGLGQAEFIKAFEDMGFRVKQRELSFPKLIIRELDE